MVEESTRDAVEQQQHAGEQHQSQGPHGEQVVEIFHRLHKDNACIGVAGEAVFEKGADEERKEAHQKGHCEDAQQLAYARTYHGVVDIIVHIQHTHDGSQQINGNAEEHVPAVEQGVEAGTGIGPVADDGLCTRQHVALFDEKVAAVKESGHGTTQQQRADDTVKDKAQLKNPCTKQVACLVLKLVTDGLYHKTEEYKHPYPVGPAEAGAIE